MTSLNTVSTLFGGTAPHGLEELYGRVFDGGGAAPPSGGPINLLAFTGKSPAVPFAPPPGTTRVIETINPSPLTYTSYDTAYTLNIAGPNGPQVSTTNDVDVRGIDVHPNDQVTMIVHDSAYSTSSQLRFSGNYLRVLQESVNRSENVTFNSRYRLSQDYVYATATNVFGATAVVSWYIQIPPTVTNIEFYYTKTEWAGFSITIT